MRKSPSMGQQLRILIDARMVSANHHGIARYTTDLVRGLHNIGHRVSTLITDDTAIEKIGESYIDDIVRCNIPYLSMTEPFRLGGLVKNNPYHLVHFTSFAVPLKMPRNGVITIHDLIHLHPPRKLHHVAYYLGVVKKALAQARKVIAVSEWTGKELQKYMEVPRDRLTVVRNGIDPKWFSPPEYENHFPEIESPFVLCVSNPKEHKNVPLLIKACEQLWNHGHKFNLVLCLGRSGIPEKWKVPSLSFKRIKVLNNVSEEELVNLYLGAKVVVSPSRLEGFNYPAAEALGLGCHVILSSGSAHDELKGSQLNFYKPANNLPALASLLLQSLKTEDQSEEPPTHNIYDNKQMAERTAEVYRQALLNG